MDQTMSVTGAVATLPDAAIAALPDRERRLADKLRSFLDISAALELSNHEERTLLDLSAREMALVRLVPGNALKVGGGKLERRVDYAVPILERMIAAIAS